jgi:hypothetical protein
MSSTIAVFISSSAGSFFIYLKNTLVWGITKPMCNWNIFCINFALFKKKYRGDLSGWTAFADYYYMRELMLHTSRCLRGTAALSGLLLIRRICGTIHRFFWPMERIDQGHLHPKLEVTRLTSLGRELNLGGEHSSKELFKQRVNSYLEHL